MEVSFRFAVRTDLGTVRTNNEDSALASDRLLVLADGMGGHAAGEVASTVATRVFADLATALDHHEDGDADIPGRLTLAGRSTRSALHEMSDADPMLESMGTTLLAVVSHGAQVTVGHIGDSRVYALRGSSLYQVTTDHTHVQRLVDTGQLTPEKARTHPYRAMLLRSLDDQPGGPDLDVIALEIEPGDRLLLCSDGLSDYLPPEEIGELLALPDRDEAAESLIDAALRFGTRDNVTVVVADVVDEAADGGTPAMVGAVVDGLELSPLASEALHQSLPSLAGLIVRSPEDDGTESAAAEATDPDGEVEPAASAVDDAGDSSDAPDSAVAAADDDGVDTDDDDATDVGTSGDQAGDAHAPGDHAVEPSTSENTAAAVAAVAAPEPPQREPVGAAPTRAGRTETVLPGVLAGCLLVIVAVVVALIL